MKTISQLFIAALLFQLSPIAHAAKVAAPLTSPISHPAHTKHNLLLYGSETFFLSHVVYKSPHNYQIILQTDLSKVLRNLLEEEKRLHPNDQFYVLLDPSDLNIIPQLPVLTGQLLRENPQGERTSLRDSIEILQYKVIYFNELPLDLSNNSHAHRDVL